MATGKLSIVGTPIGNMEDITLRALRVLREADLIAAEDTRRTAQLLNRYEIKKPLISYHEFNEAKRTAELLEKLQEGRHIALVSDAGMPVVSDPGQRLIRAVLAAQERCSGASAKRQTSAENDPHALRRSAATNREHGTVNPELPISIEIIPGPSAVTMAIAASGLPVVRKPSPRDAATMFSRQSPDPARHLTEGLPETSAVSGRDGPPGRPQSPQHGAPGGRALPRRTSTPGGFLFYGFLPHKSAQRRRALSHLAPLPFTLVFFESPYRLLKCLGDMHELLGNRNAVVARELTKKFEEILRGDLATILKKLENRSVKGEITVVIEGREE